ncbi:MAG: hypothetical protein K9J06_15070 [Flavobacteriales bacterium]|nr:hypothetical protein [Flavobacteriales bacterium]
MAERITEHPLRTIRLVYDDNKQETEADSTLLKRYVALHDAYLDVRKKHAKLRYDFMELEPDVDRVDEAFVSVLDRMRPLIEEGKVLVTKVKRKEVIYELMERMRECNEHIQHFHNDLLMPLSQSMDELQAEWEAYNEADAQFDEQYEQFNKEIEQPFYKNYDAYAIDLCRYDDDKQELLGLMDRESEKDDIDRVSDKYDGLVNGVNAVYAEWKTTHELINGFFDASNLLDRTISEACVTGTLPKEHQPLYLLPPSDSLITDFASNYGMLADPANHTVTFSVPKEVVLEGDTGMIHELILTLQHYPGLLEKLLFSIDLTFLTEYDTEIPEEEWKGIEVPVRWVHSFISLPCVYFFLKDHDVRSYFLMGDMVFDGKVTPSSEGDHVKVEGEALETLADRVFNICVFFMLYCHNTGFDPSETIQRTLTELDLPFALTLNDIRTEYEKQIRDGVEIRAVSVKKGE